MAEVTGKHDRWMFKYLVHGRVPDLSIGIENRKVHELNPGDLVTGKHLSDILYVLDKNENQIHGQRFDRFEDDILTDDKGSDHYDIDELGLYKIRSGIQHEFKLLMRVMWNQEQEYQNIEGNCKFLRSLDIHLPDGEGYLLDDLSPWLEDNLIKTYEKDRELFSKYSSQLKNEKHRKRLIERI